MATRIRQMAIVCGIVVVFFVPCAAIAQVSGVPGDGIPDFYYFPSDGLTVPTSFGPVSRPVGTMLMDTDGFDVNAVLIAGLDVTTRSLGCDLCEGMNLPQTSATSAGTYTVGYGGAAPNGSSQWIRTSPLQGSGFIGVIGTGFLDGNGVPQPWPADFPPFLDFPSLGLANYGPGLSGDDFPRIFNDGLSEALWSIRVASGATGQALFTNVANAPEPTSGLLSLLGLVALSFPGCRQD